MGDLEGARELLHEVYSKGRLISLSRRGRYPDAWASRIRKHERHVAPVGAICIYKGQNCINKLADYLVGHIEWPFSFGLPICIGCLLVHSPFCAFYFAGLVAVCLSCPLALALSLAGAGLWCAG